MSDLVRWRDAGFPSLLSWDPWRMFEQLETTQATWPAFDVVDRPDALEVKVDVPGMKESDLAITLTGRTLSISGQRLVDVQDRNGPYVIQRRFAGAFERRLDLAPGLDVDHIEAALRDGVLTVKLPKQDAIKPRKIALGNVVDKVRGLLGSHRKE
jgi:HSP20 family protein